MLCFFHEFRQTNWNPSLKITIMNNGRNRQRSRSPRSPIRHQRYSEGPRDFKDGSFFTSNADNIRWYV